MSTTYRKTNIKRSPKGTRKDYGFAKCKLPECNNIVYKTFNNCNKKFHSRECYYKYKLGRKMKDL